jgi:hypothetical protein
MARSSSVASVSKKAARAALKGYDRATKAIGSVAGLPRKWAGSLVGEKNPSDAYRAGMADLRSAAARHGTVNLTPSIAQREEWRHAWGDYMKGWNAEKRQKGNPPKFDRCVRDVKRKGGAVDPYAVCTAAGTRNPSDRANMTFDRESGDYIVFGVAVPGGAQHFPTVGKAEAAIRRYGGTAIRTKGRRKNPEEAEGDLYESFHGKPATSTIFVNEEFEEVRDLETLGILVNFWVATIRDPRKGTLIETSDAEGDFDEVGADEDTVFLAANRSGTQLYFVGGDQSLDLDKLKFTGDWVKPAMIIGVMYELTYRTRKKFDKFELTDYYHGLGEETGDQPTLMYDSLSPHCAVVGGKYKIKVPLVGMSPGIEN